MGEKKKWLLAEKKGKGEKAISSCSFPWLPIDSTTWHWPTSILSFSSFSFALGCCVDALFVICIHSLAIIIISPSSSRSTLCWLKIERSTLLLLRKDRWDQGKHVEGTFWKKGKGQMMMTCNTLDDKVLVLWSDDLRLTSFCTRPSYHLFSRFRCRLSFPFPLPFQSLFIAYTDCPFFCPCLSPLFSTSQQQWWWW